MMNNNGRKQTTNGHHKPNELQPAEPDSKEKILLIDDDAGILRMLGLTLQRFGYKLETADDGRTGLAKAETFKPDLIILDVMMPDLSGLEVCRRLRSNPATARIPILMLSAKASDIDKAAGFQAGADDYLVKPVGVKMLLARVEGVLLRARYMPQQSGVTVALLGAKGGVGTTCLGINLAAALAVKQQKVIMAELREARGTLHHFLHLKTHQHMGSLFSMEPSQLNAAEIGRRLVHYAPGLDLLLAPPGHYTLALTADHMETMVHLLSHKSDYLLLDLPTPPMPNIVPALEKADHIFLITEPESISMACAMSTLKMLGEWGLSNLVKVITVTRAAAAALLTKSDIEEQLNGIPLLTTIPPATEMLQESARMGKSLLELRPQSMPANAYKSLADWLLEKHAETAVKLETVPA
jgi:pilus assembly protein CpaE